jgi:hypothetical protein
MNDFYKTGFFALCGVLTTGLIAFLMMKDLGKDLQYQIDQKADWNKVQPIIQREVDEDMENHEKLVNEKFNQIVVQLTTINKEIEKNSRTIEAGLTTQRTFLAETAKLWVRMEDWIKEKTTEDIE